MPSLRALIALLLLPAGLTVVSSPASPVSAAGAMTGAPASGSCYDLTTDQAFGRALHERPVDCSGTHTARAIGVRQLPARLTWSSPRRKLEGFAIRACGSSTRQTLGSTTRTIYLTLYATFWFRPTGEQQEDGARWFSCFLALWDGEALLPMPEGRLPRADTRRPADSVAWCLARGLGTVPCTEPHRWRAKRAFFVPNGGTGRVLTESARQAIRRKCSSMAWGPHRWHWFRWGRQRLIAICFVQDGPWLR